MDNTTNDIIQNTVPVADGFGARFLSFTRGLMTFRSSSLVDGEFVPDQGGDVIVLSVGNDEAVIINKDMARRLLPDLARLAVADGVEPLTGRVS